MSPCNKNHVKLSLSGKACIALPHHAQLPTNWWFGLVDWWRFGGETGWGPIYIPSTEAGAELQTTNP